MSLEATESATTESEEISSLGVNETATATMMEQTIENHIQLIAISEGKAYNATMKDVVSKSFSLLYDTKRTWRDDQREMMDAKRITLLGKWSIKEFDGAMEFMQNHRAPKWCALLKMSADLREQSDEAYTKLRTAHDSLKGSLKESRLLREKYMHPLPRALFGIRRSLSDDQSRLRRFYSRSWKPYMKEVKREHNTIVGHHKGILHQVKKFGLREMTENERISKEVHDLQEQQQRSNDGKYTQPGSSFFLSQIFCFLCSASVTPHEHNDKNTVGSFGEDTTKNQSFESRVDNKNTNGEKDPCSSCMDHSPHLCNFESTKDLFRA